MEDWKQEPDRAYDYIYYETDGTLIRCTYCHSDLPIGIEDPCSNKTCQARAALLGQTWD